jgi:hypothetical protein
MRSNGDGAKATVLRTEEDLPMTLVLGGSLAIVVAIFAAPVLDIDILTALLVVVFGFFFVTVSSRITGEIGSSSNPISGMTIATLILTCGLFVLIGRTGVSYKAMALSTAALVCVAASNGGTISQDLKTGYLVGATPRLQQIAIAVGVITSALAIGITLLIILGAGESFQPVKYDGIKLAPTSETAKGPDGQTYKVAFQQDTGSIKRGKYLVTNGGEPAFFVESAVESNYPYKLKRHTGQLPADTTAVAGKDSQVLMSGGKEIGKEVGTDLGLDRQSYRVVELATEVNGVKPGRYLVDANQTITHRFAAGPTKMDAPKAQLFAPDHRRHARRRPALGPGADRGVHRHHPRAGRGGVAAVRGGPLPQHRDLGRHLHRRRHPLARRSQTQRRVGRRGRVLAGHAHGLGPHRRWLDRRRDPGHHLVARRRGRRRLGRARSERLPADVAADQPRLVADDVLHGHGRRPVLGRGQAQDHGHGREVQVRRRGSGRRGAEVAVDLQAGACSAGRRPHCGRR